MTDPALAVAVFASEWSHATNGTSPASGGIDVTDEQNTAWGAVAREGGALWLADNPEHYMAEAVRNWLGPEGT